MISNIRLISSGFSFIDRNWGGIYRGGSYMVIGPKKSGRTLLGLQYALESAKRQEVCLYFTNMRPKDLMIQAASLNFDIQAFMNQNLIIVVRVAPPNDIYETQNPDEHLVEYLNDIVMVVNQYNPSRIIFDELTPYIGFNKLDLLRNTFLKMLETIEDKDITSLFIVGEPATQRAKGIIDTITQYITGSVTLQKKDEKIAGKYFGGLVVITPNVGHTEGQFTATYIIEPNKGVTVESAMPKKTGIINKPEVKPIAGADVSPEAYSYSNIYNYGDFLLILNNQIGLFKSTGQTFNLVAIKLEEAAIMKGLLTLTQLQNAVKFSVDKKDKICVVDDKVLVLLIRSDQSSANKLMTTLKRNLPGADPDFLNAALENISVLNIEIDEKIDNADNMMEYVLSAENESNQIYVPITKYTL
jgi:KaiC/GvpD/RAD55 family RecA-like ATPase